MKTMKTIVMLSMLAFFCLVLARDILDTDSPYRDVSPQQAKRLMEKYPDIKIIDVSGIYEKGHIPGAVNYYIGDGTFDEALESLDKKDRYLVYYHTTKPSITAAEKLHSAGFKRVYRLKGNYFAWVQAGFETAHKATT